MKVSLRHPLMLPAVALVDPELTYSLPPDVTASTGLDALTQCIEPFVTPVASPLSDGIAREGMRRAAGALRTGLMASAHEMEPEPYRAMLVQAYNAYRSDNRYAADMAARHPERFAAAADYHIVLDC